MDGHKEDIRSGQETFEIRYLFDNTGKPLSVVIVNFDQNKNITSVTDIFDNPYPLGDAGGAHPCWRLANGQLY